MARPTNETERGGAIAGLRRRLAGLEDERLDATVTALLLVSVVGFLLDVRSHMDGLDFSEEGFLTPEHTVVYGGVVAAALLVGVVMLAGKDATTTWRDAVPDGYGLGVVGLGLFALGGPGDLLWHAAFGAEANVEALVSPTHLLLATGAALFGTSPLRAAWRREGPAGLPTQFAVVGTAAQVVTIFTGFTLYSHPAVQVPGGDPTFPALPLAGVQFHAALLVGTLLLLVGRFRLRPGSLTVLVGFNGAAMTLLGQTIHLLPAYLLAGVIADLLYATLRPTDARPRAVRVFAAAVPAVLTALHFGLVALGDGVAWTVHLWAGAIFLAGAAGLLVSYLAVPPRGPSPRRA